MTDDEEFDAHLTGFHRHYADRVHRRAKFAFVANLPVDQAARLRRFKDNHRLTSPGLVIYLMNRAGIDPEGEEITMIDYGTLMPRK